MYSDYHSCVAFMHTFIYCIVFTTTGPDDYSILSEQLIFSSGSTPGITMCRDIQIEPDNIPETIERFSVITTADGAPDGMATILINDDDGKSHVFLLQT